MTIQTLNADPADATITARTTITSATGSITTEPIPNDHDLLDAIAPGHHPTPPADEATTARMATAANRSATGAIATGRDLLDAIARGRLPAPPAADLLRLDLEQVGDGTTRFGFDAHPEFGNPSIVHGGILAAIIDFAVATAAWTVHPADARIVTADLHVTFLRPIPLDGTRYTCVGRVIHLGRSQVNAVAEIEESTGDIFVYGLATCRALPPG